MRHRLAAILGSLPVPAGFVVAGLMVIGLLGADRTVGDVFELEEPTGIPAIVIGVTFGLCALLAWSLPHDPGGQTRGARFLTVGLALASLALFTGIEQRALEAAGASEAVLKATVAATLLAGAGLALLLLVAVRSRLAHAPGRSGADAALAILRRVDPGRAAVALVVACLLICGLGALVLVADLPIQSMTINAEATYPQYFNAGLLLTAGAFSLLAWRTRAGSPINPLWWCAFGLFLIYLAIDETTGLHERVQSKADLDPLLILSPIAAVGVVLFFATFREARRDRRSQALYLLGASCFALSQFVDLAGDSNLASALEETFETFGSALLAAALFLVAGDLGRGPGGEGPTQR